MADHLKREYDRDSQVSAHHTLRFTLAYAYIITVGALLLVPLVAMAWRPTQEGISNTELAAVPLLRSESGINLSFAQDVGHYFEDHFAFRNELIDFNARALKYGFATSATEKVILGSDGWLYYQGTLDDYQKTNPMSDRAISNAAHNIALAQEFIESHDAQFIMCFVPDKNALYPEHMPLNVPATQGLTNAQRIEQISDKLGVNWINLRQVLSATDDVLYLERDSHWTNTGAFLAYKALMTQMGYPYHDFAASPTYESQHFGDLDTMLTPLSAVPETQKSYQDTEQYVHVEPVESVEASSIHTIGNLSDAHGHLLMYRDSFGNAWLPFFASSFEESFFSKKIPYDLGLIDVYKPDLVVFERTERHASTFATNPPYMDAPLREVPNSFERFQSETTVTAHINGPYLQIDGSVDSRYLGQNSLVYLELFSGDESICVDTFLVSSLTEQVSDVDEIEITGSEEIRGDYGFRAFINRVRCSVQDKTMSCRVFVVRDSNALLVFDDEVVISNNER